MLPTDILIVTAIATACSAVVTIGINVGFKVSDRSREDRRRAEERLANAVSAVWVVYVEAENQVAFYIHTQSEVFMKHFGAPSEKSGAWDMIMQLDVELLRQSLWLPSDIESTFNSLTLNLMKFDSRFEDGDPADLWKSSVVSRREALRAALRSAIGHTHGPLSDAAINGRFAIDEELKKHRSLTDGKS